jgi:hypothetical protein
LVRDDVDLERLAELAPLALLAQVAVSSSTSGSVQDRDCSLVDGDLGVLADDRGQDGGERS